MAAVTNLLWLNPNSIPENIAPGDTVTAPGDWTFTENVDIHGNLVVTGSITSGSTLNSVSHDAFFDLGFGYLLNTQNQPGGFTLDTRLAAGFVPGQVTNFPTLTSFVYTDTGGCTLLSANDVVMITNLPPAFLGNEGYYIVQSVSGAAFPQTVTIYGLSQTSTPWANTSFVTTGAVIPPGNAAKINLAVVAVADGTASFKDAAGTPYPVGKVVSAYITNASLPQFQANGAYEAIGATTLQEAYDNGNTIVTGAARDIAFTLTSGDFTVDGPDAFVIGSTTPVNQYSLTTLTSISITAGTDTSISAGGNTSLNATGLVFADQHLMFRNKYAGTGILANEALVVGEVVAIEGTTNPTLTTQPRVVKANAGAAELNERRLFGIVSSAALGAGASGYAATVPGLCVPVLFDPASIPLAASQNGDPVFVSTVSGRASMSAPITPGHSVMQIGQLASAAAVAANTYSVFLMPQFIGRVPA